MKSEHKVDPSKKTVLSAIQAFFTKAVPFTRPRELIKAIDESYQKAKSSKHGYICTGSSHYGVQLHGINVDSNTILQAFSQEDKAGEICDVGAGNFAFNKSMGKFKKVKCYGITAANFSDYKPDETHVFANAEYLSTVFGLNKFNFIFSHATYMHFVDPVGSVIEAYKTLKPGGVLIIDKFSIPGCEEYPNKIIDYLQSQGYLVLGSDDKGWLGSFIIQKTLDKPELYFPVSYTSLKEHKAFYTPQTKLLNSVKAQKEDKQLYKEGSEQLQDILRRECKNSELLEKCENLPALFSHSQYNKLNKIEKYYLILGMVNKQNPDHGSILSKCESMCSNELFKYAFEDLLIRNNPAEWTSLFYLPHDSRYFNNLPTDQQLLLIEAIAAHNIINLAHSVHTMGMLKKMGLPFTKQKIGDSYSDDNVLEFPKIANMKSSTSTVVLKR